MAMTRRDPVLLAWLVGLGLAGLIFAVGPDRFLFRFWDTLHVFMWQVAEALDNLSAVALDAVRALAIGLYVTFLALAFAVARRGGRARGAIVVVTVLFLVLVGDATPGSQARWLAALCVSGIAAAVMTGRLRPPALPARF